MDPILKKLTLANDIELHAIVEKLAKIDGNVTVGFLNQHGYNLIMRSKEIEKYFFDLDFMFRDGKGIELACLYNKVDPKLNLNGTDFIPQLIDRILGLTNKATFFAYGTQSPWLENGANKLFKGYDFFCLDGFQDIDCYEKHFLNHKKNELNVVVLAMGMPKQEAVAKRLKKICTGNMLVICGGAILDFQAGRVRRCPLIFQKLGLEWLYRLLNEPKRLFGRYVLGIPLFLKNIITAKRKARRNYGQ